MSPKDAADLLPRLQACTWDPVSTWLSLYGKVWNNFNDCDIHWYFWWEKFELVMTHLINEVLERSGKSGKRLLRSVRIGSSYWTLYRQLDDLESICILSIGILCAVGAGVPLPLMAIVFKNVIEAFPPPAEQLNQAVHSLLGIATAYFVLTWAWTVCWGVVGGRISNRLQESLVENILGQDMEFFDTQSLDLTSILTADTQIVQRGTSEKVGLFLQSISYFVATFITGFILSPPLTGVLFAAVFPTMIILVVTGSTLVSKNSKEAGIHTERAASLAEQAIKAIQVVQAFGVQDILSGSHASKLQDAKHFALRKSIVSAILLASIYFICYSTNALAFFWGAKLGGNSGTIYAIVFLILDASFVFTQVGPFIQTIAMASSSGSKILGLINQPRPKIDPYAQQGRCVSSADFTSDIVCDNISFAYPIRKERPVLHNTSMIFKPGSTSGIVGLSGSGKSSLVGLLLRFYDVDSGKIQIGGQNITSINLRSLRANMSFVDQEPVLFSGSILDNVMHGISGAECLTLDEIRRRCEKAAQLANADFIPHLEHGIDTVVGSHGGTLSGGQRQRICLARALVRNPSLLILDEPTSALDSTSESKILEALRKVSQSGCTIIMIAHRLSTIKDMDNIIVMSEGQVEEQGTHGELLAKENGAYKALVKAQNIELGDFHSDAESTAPGGPHERKAGKDVFAGQQLSSGPLPVSMPGLVPGQAPGSVPGHVLDHSDLQRPISASKSSTPTGVDRVGSGDTITPRRLILRCLKLSSRNDVLLLILGLCASAIMGALIVYEAIVFGHLVVLLQSGGVGGEVLSQVKFYCLMFFVISLIALFASGTSNACFGTISESLHTKIRDEAVRSILTQDQKFFQESGNSAHRLVASISSDANHIAGLSGSIVATLFSVCVNIVAGITVALVFAWSVALVLFSVIPVIILAGYLRVTMLTGFEKRHHESFKNAAALASEAVQNIRTVAAFGSEKKFLTRYNAAITQPFSQNFRFCVIGDLGLTLSYSIVFFTYALAYWWGAHQVRAGQISHLDFFTMLPAFLLTAQQSAQLFTAAPELLLAKTAAKRLFKILDTKPTIMRHTASNAVEISTLEKQVLSSPASTSSNTLNLSQSSSRLSSMVSTGPVESHTVELLYSSGKLQATGASISFSHLSFAYPNKPSTTVLNNVDFEVPRGSIVGVVGPSGAGKSSLISLLERFHDPCAGSILLDGCDIRGLPVDEYRGQLSYVPQEPSLFEGTIAYNIQMGALHLRQKELPALSSVESICKHYGLHSFISSMPDGYATEVGPGGSRLSGGQKQRIAIARALMRQPRVLILDEATSALDAHSEQEVQRILTEVKAEGRTVIMIAHRMATVQGADEIVVLDKGTVIERGTHDTLINTGGMYSQMTRTQHLG